MTNIGQRIKNIFLASLSSKDDLLDRIQNSTGGSRWRYDKDLIHFLAWRGGLSELKEGREELLRKYGIESSRKPFYELKEIEDIFEKATDGEDTLKLLTHFLDRLKLPLASFVFTCGKYLLPKLREILVDNENFYFFFKEKEAIVQFLFKHLSREVFKGIYRDNWLDEAFNFSPSLDPRGDFFEVVFLIKLDSNTYMRDYLPSQELHGSYVINSFLKIEKSLRGLATDSSRVQYEFFAKRLIERSTILEENRSKKTGGILIKKVSFQLKKNKTTEDYKEFIYDIISSKRNMHIVYNADQEKIKLLTDELDARNENGDFIDLEYLRKFEIKLLSETPFGRKMILDSDLSPLDIMELFLFSEAKEIIEKVGLNLPEKVFSFRLSSTRYHYSLYELPKNKEELTNIDKGRKAVREYLGKKIKVAGKLERNKEKYLSSLQNSWTKKFKFGEEIVREAERIFTYHKERNSTIPGRKKTTNNLPGADNAEGLNLSYLYGIERNLELMLLGVYHTNLSVGDVYCSEILFAFCKKVNIDFDSLFKLVDIGMENCYGTWWLNKVATPEIKQILVLDQM